jgi:hypothetical protein
MFMASAFMFPGLAQQFCALALLMPISTKAIIINDILRIMLCVERLISPKVRAGALR